LLGFVFGDSCQNVNRQFVGVRFVASDEINP